MKIFTRMMKAMQILGSKDGAESIFILTYTYKHDTAYAGRRHFLRGEREVLPMKRSSTYEEVSLIGKSSPGAMMK